MYAKIESCAQGRRILAPDNEEISIWHCIAAATKANMTILYELPGRTSVLHR